VITKFFKSYLFLRTSKELEEKIEFKVTSNKPYLVKLRDYYRSISDERDKKDLGPKQ
jgi:hypothetical protein